jgi:hypothetical protein
MMPQGFEHTGEEAFYAAEPETVPTSVMPKGVECKTCKPLTNH